MLLEGSLQPFEGSFLFPADIQIRTVAGWDKALLSISLPASSAARSHRPRVTRFRVASRQGVFDFAIAERCSIECFLCCQMPPHTFLLRGTRNRAQLIAKVGSVPFGGVLRLRDGVVIPACENQARCYKKPG